jgi:hypothetical protein
MLTAGGVLLVVAGALVAAALTAPGDGATRAAGLLPGLSRPTPGTVTEQPVVPFAGTGLVDRREWADVDADSVADRVEEALCGSATCAVPWADLDGDGVSDAVEVLVCGTAGCVDPAVDANADRIPDFAGVLLCGDGGCSGGTLRADVDADGVENWVEVLIAGDALGASVTDDLDGDGISDAAALMECLRRAPLARTGAEVWWLLAAAAAAGGAGLVLRGWRDLRAVPVVGSTKGASA